MLFECAYTNLNSAIAPARSERLPFVLTDVNQSDSPTERFVRVSEEFRPVFKPHAGTVHLEFARAADWSIARIYQVHQLRFVSTFPGLRDGSAVRRNNARLRSFSRMRPSVFRDASWMAIFRKFQYLVTTIRNQPFEPRECRSARGAGIIRSAGQGIPQGRS